jgi:DNA recombination protein RmuC
MEMLLVLTGIAVGGFAGWMIAWLKASSSSQGALLVEQEKNRSMALQLHELKTNLERERTNVLEANNSLASLEADYRNLQEKLSDQRKELEMIHEKITLQFKNLANDIFEEKTRKFTDQSKSSIGELLKPLGEKIVEFEKKVEDTHRDSISRSSALREQLESLQRLNLQMTREAENLTRALKGDSKTQGAWGEFILESILETSGLSKDREYSIQESFTTEEGRYRPDVIIRLPENRHVVIDSKVSLTAYNNFVNSTTDDEKIAAIKSHLFSIRQHIRNLAEKNYQNISENNLDFVIMFIPIEPAYILAIQTEKNLYEEALKKRIVFVSPTLLIPSLQLIKNVWKQEYQNRNSQEIARQATALYEKFVGFSNDLQDVGSQMKKTQSIYDQAITKLTTGNGNLVRSVEKLKALGLKPTKDIDKRLLDRSADQPELFE